MARSLIESALKKAGDIKKSIGMKKTEDILGKRFKEASKKRNKLIQKTPLAQSVKLLKRYL